MSNWYQDNSQSIGRTPLVRLNRIIGNSKATVLAKIEGRNPGCLAQSGVWPEEQSSQPLF